MIPRILTSQHAQEIIQGFLWGFLALYNGSMYILGVLSEADWNRVTGPHAFLFGLLIAVGVLWNTGRTREKNEAKRQKEASDSANASRAELLKALKESIDSNHDLTKQCIRAIEKQTAATAALDKTIQHHTTFLSDKFESTR